MCLAYIEVLWKNWSSSSSQLSWHLLLAWCFPVQKVLQMIHHRQLILHPGYERQSGYLWGPVQHLDWDAGALRGVASIIFLPYSHTIEISHQRLYLIKLLILCEDWELILSFLQTNIVTLLRFHIRNCI